MRKLACAFLFLLLQACATPLSEVPPIQCPPANAAAGDLALVSWNIHGLPFTRALAQRLDNIADQVLLCGPDVVLLQEAWFEGDAARLEKRLGERYARIADAREVREGVFGLFGFRRGGLLSLVRTGSQWKADTGSSFEAFAVAAPWYRLTELDGVADKGMQRFAIAQGERRLTLVNTHFQSRYGPDRQYTDLRASQADQLLRLVQPIPGALLVAGDFNTTPRERLYRVLTGRLVDLTESLRERERGTYFDAWVDYVFAARGAAPVVAGALLLKNVAPDDPFSDHDGIWLRLAVGR